MEIITVGAPGVAYVALRNHDLTEGRGATIPESFHLDPDAAEIAAYGADVQGRDGSSYEIATNVITPNSPIWSTQNGAAKKFGEAYFFGNLVSLRVEDYPDWSESEWEEYRKLTREFGDTLRETERDRRAALKSRTEKETGGIYFVTYSMKGAIGSYSYKWDSVAGVLEAKDDEAAAKMFVEACAIHPELKGHRLYGGALGSNDYLLDELVEELEVPSSKVKLTSAQLSELPESTLVTDGEGKLYRMRWPHMVTNTKDAEVFSVAAHLEAGGTLRLWTDADATQARRSRFEELLSKRAG